MTAKNPQSLLQKKFQNLHEIDNGIIADDFVYENNEAWKFNIKSQTGAQVTYETKLNSTKDFKLTMNDTIKMKFPFHENKWVWFGAKRNGDIKLHFDMGDLQLPYNKSINVFGNMKTNMNFSNYAFRIGYNYFGKNHIFSERLSYGGCCNPECSALSMKYLYKNENYFAGLFTTLRLPSHIPCYYEGMVGYFKNQFKCYLQYQSKSCDVKACNTGKFSFVPGNIIATAIYEKSKCKFGGELNFDIKNMKPCLQLAYQRKITDNHILKTKLDCCCNFSLAIKHKFTNFISMKFGAFLPLKGILPCCKGKTGCCKDKTDSCQGKTDCCKGKTDCCKDVKSCCPLQNAKYGFEFELNL